MLETRIHFVYCAKRIATQFLAASEFLINFWLFVCRISTRLVCVVCVCLAIHFFCSFVGRSEVWEKSTKKNIFDSTAIGDCEPLLDVRIFRVPFRWNERRMRRMKEWKGRAEAAAAAVAECGRSYCVFFFFFFCHHVTCNQNSKQKKTPFSWMVKIESFFGIRWCAISSRTEEKMIIKKRIFEIETGKCILYSTLSTCVCARRCIERIEIPQKKRK